VNFGRILDHSNVCSLVSGIAEFADRSGATCEQALFVRWIDPRSRNYPRTIARADFVLVGIDQRIKCRSINQTFFNQQGFQGFDSQSDVRRNVLVNVTLGVPMIRYGRRPCGSDRSSQEIASGCIHQWPSVPFNRNSRIALEAKRPDNMWRARG
jgi:hypothetical protein